MNDTATYVQKDQAFERDMSYIPDRILAGEHSADPLDDAFPSGSKDSPRDGPVRSRPSIRSRTGWLSARSPAMSGEMDEFMPPP